MIRKRVIPTLLLRNQSLVKTVNFNKFTYIGDPCNAARIFNELEVDELLFLDITATMEKRSPNFELLSQITSECFMPLAYGGGIRTVEDAKTLFDMGIEKIVLGTAAVENPKLIKQLSLLYGSQAIVISIDVKKNFFRKNTVRTRSGTKNTNYNPVAWAQEVEDYGAGEILLTSIDREGTWLGPDLGLVKEVADAISIPLIASGGVANIKDISDLINKANASAVGVGNLVVFQKQGMGVLINFPDKSQLEPAIT